MSTPTYVKISKQGLKPGVTLAVSLYLYMPLNNKVVLFKTAGHALTETDCENLKAVAEGCLVALKSDLESKVKIAASKIERSLATKGDAGLTAEVKEEAGKILRDLNCVIGRPQAGKAQTELLSLHEYTTSIVCSVKGAMASKAHASLIASLEDKTEPLVTHQMQVSALAVMFLLAEGGDPGELVDLATAGLIHDLGLSIGNPEHANTHFTGGAETAAFKDADYRVHPENSLKVADSILGTTRLNQATRQAVLYHHEYLDESGLKGTTSLMIPRLARFLRIADDVICALGNPGNTRNLEETLAQLTHENLIKCDRMIISTIHMHFLTPEGDQIPPSPE